MMNSVINEIDNALAILKIPPERFSKLSDTDGENLFQDLLETFVTGGDRKWWWEAFSRPEHSVVFEDGKGFSRITDIVPTSTELVWFVVEDDHLPCYPIYEAYPSDIQNVIGECYGFEYYIVSKTQDWLLCENHHNRMIGVGDEVIQKLKICSA